ncbi:MAG TPA: protein phosphatase CheZ [Rhodocyclaceae bacterium]
MVKPVNFDESGDSEDLQALFDTIAATPPAPPPPPAPASKAADGSGDSDELQALFDSVSDQVAAPAAAGDEGSPQEAAFNKIGHMARQLHDSLRQLGYDKMLQDSANRMPDTRERLTYIAQMTEQAASRVLNATDVAKPLQDALLAESEALGARWERMFANQLSVDEFKALAADSRAFFAGAPAKIKGTNAQLTEIMMAQDFQDLTGQVIKKVVEMVQGLEGQLLKVLIEVMPEDRRAAAPEGLMNGPVVNAAGRSDVVTSQAQVDDLLESLGF